jgi:sugar phosphate isomerase/epimerase
MQLGFVSAILGDLSLEEVVSFAAVERFDCLELMCWPPGKADRRYAGITHLDVTALDQVAVDRVRRLMAEAGIAISGLGYYPNPLDPDEQAAGVYTRHIERVIEAAALLNVGLVNTFVGRDWTRSVDDNWPRFCQVWKPLVKFAAERGVRIGIENCPMYFSRDEWPGGKNLATSPAIWRRMFAEIPSAGFGLNYDPSHLVWQMMNYTRPLAEFASRLFHVHAKDVHIDLDRLDDVGMLALPLAYHRPTLPGLGDIRWGEFVARLGEVGYDGPVCIEVEDRVYEKSLATRKLALRQSRIFLRQFIAEPVR